MSVYPESVPAFHLAALIKHLHDRGEPCLAVLEAHKLSIDALALPEARIPRKLMAALLMDLMERTGREDLGFEMGMQTDLLGQPVLGRLLLNSPSLGEGLTRLAPYMPLATPSFRMRCELSPEGLQVSWHPVYALPYNIARMAVETILVSVYRTCRRLFPTSSTPMRAEVAWAPPRHADRYSALSDLSVAYQSLQDDVGVRIMMPSAVTRLALPHADALLWSETRSACAAQVDRLAAMQHWGDWIRHILDVVEDRQPGQAELAGLMGVSVRTLARHLEKEGIQFRELVQSTLQRRACALLEVPDASVSEVARVLGYSDSANFSRAFKSMTGLAPAAYMAKTRHRRQESHRGLSNQ